MSQITNHWDTRARDFDETPGNTLTTGEQEAWKSLLRSQYGECSGRLIDVGCGTGTYSLLLAELGFTVQGVDSSAIMIDKAKQKAASRDTDGARSVEFVRGAAEDVHGEFDAVFSRNVFWMIADPGRVIRGLWASTTDTAVWIAVETIWDGIPRGDFRAVGGSLPGFTGWHPNELRDAFVRNGFGSASWISISNRAELATADDDLHMLMRAGR